MDALVLGYFVYGVLILVASVPLLVFFFVRDRNRTIGRSLIFGWFCAIVATVLGLSKVASEGEMAGYAWLFVYTPLSAIASLFAGFAIFYAIVTRLSK